jgi:hypothetical protein
MEKTYANADARPHRNDTVKFENGRHGEVTGRVSEMRTQSGERQVFVVFANFRREKKFTPDQLRLVTPSMPRFDGYEPEQ